MRKSVYTFLLLIEHRSTLFVCILIIYTLTTGRKPELVRLTLWATLLVALVTWTAFLSGEPAEDVIRQYFDVTAKHALHEHEGSAKRAMIPLQGMGLIAIVGLVRLYKKRPVFARMLYGLLFLSLISLGMISYTASLGGKISHAETR